MHTDRQAHHRNGGCCKRLRAWNRCPPAPPEPGHGWAVPRCPGLPLGASIHCFHLLPGKWRANMSKCRDIMCPLKMSSWDSANIVINIGMINSWKKKKVSSAPKWQKSEQTLWLFWDYNPSDKLNVLLSCVTVVRMGYYHHKACLYSNYLVNKPACHYFSSQLYPA